MSERCHPGLWVVGQHVVATTSEVAGHASTVRVVLGTVADAVHVLVGVQCRVQVLELLVGEDVADPEASARAGSSAGRGE